MGASASLQPLPPLVPVSYVDLRRYSGRWWQIALMPNSFQLTSAHNVTATYTPNERDPTTLAVLNEAYDAHNHRTWIGGRAQIDPVAAASDTTRQPGRLIVFFEPNDTQPFVWPLGAPYWIIELGSGADYGYAIVSDPMRRFLWILSRTPQLDETTIRGILGRLITVHGFAAERLADIVWTRNDAAPPADAKEHTPGGPDNACT